MWSKVARPKSTQCDGVVPCVLNILNIDLIDAHVCYFFDIGLIHKLWEGLITVNIPKMRLSMSPALWGPRWSKRHGAQSVGLAGDKKPVAKDPQLPSATRCFSFQWFWCVEVTEVNEHDPTPFWFSAIVSQWVRTTWRPSVRRKFRSSEENSRASSCRSGQFSTTRSRCRQTRLAGKSPN